MALSEVVAESPAHKVNVATGVAIAFFRCEASRVEVLDSLPKLRSLASTPRDARVELFAAGDLYANADTRLRRLITAVKKEERGYALYAVVPQASNKKAAEALNDIMCAAWVSPIYKGEKDDFFGRIVYEDGGKYVAVES